MDEFCQSYASNSFKLKNICEETTENVEGMVYFLQTFAAQCS